MSELKVCNDRKLITVDCLLSILSEFSEPPKDVEAGNFIILDQSRWKITKEKCNFVYDEINGY